VDPVTPDRKGQLLSQIKPAFTVKYASMYRLIDVSILKLVFGM